MIKAKTYEICYRYKDGLATTTVWASTEEQAEKKFKARSEFEYDPEYDRHPEEGNIRSIYVMQKPKKKKNKELDELKKFVIFPQYYDFFKKYDSGQEKSLVKQVPLTKQNIMIINEIAKKIYIVRRYRGPRAKNIHRECHKHLAERVSVYIR